MLICPDDKTQQYIHLSGLVYTTHFKLKQVSAPGQDPLARGWTRGGEICMWVAKGGKTEQDIGFAALHDNDDVEAIPLPHERQVRGVS